MVTGYILTGGKNRRMEGRKKLFLEYEGKPFYQHILEAFAPLECVVLSVDEFAPYEAAALPMIRDKFPDMGPMGGICSGLEECPADALFVTACDMPHIDRSSVELLLESYRATGALTLAQSQGRVQPLFGVYPRSVLPVLREMIGEGNLRMMAFLSRVGYVAVPLEENSRAADNINTSEEYANLISGKN